jgi:hypothetical protein
VNNTLTFNLGARWERQHSYLPEQTYDGARDFPTVFPAGSFPYIDVQTFSRVVPRAGVAWDLGGKSVVKATFGQYNYILGDTYADDFNRNATANAVFRWHDLNGDTLYQPGEVNFDLSGPDYQSISSASNRILNPNLKQPSTWETTSSYEREIAASLGIRAMYVYKVVTHSLTDVNILRPYSAYSLPITRRDPGADGALGTPDDAGSITLYDYTAAYRGGTFSSTQTSNSANTDRFHSIEFTLTKRASRRWMGQVSYFAVKNHRWLARTFNNPNDEFFPLDETWSWAGNVTGSCRFPAGFSVSGFLQSKSGVQGQRTYIFRQTDPDGGPSIAQNGNTTLRLEPYGSRRLTAFNILNLRVTKDFKLGPGRKLGIDVDVFNALNSATPTGARFDSGPTFGFATGVVPPRIARFGGRFTF